jgi:hypothetical protein
MLAVGIVSVVFIGHFILTHKYYLVLTGLLFIFFVGVSVWPQKRPAVGESGPDRPAKGPDIVS